MRVHLVRHGRSQQRPSVHPSEWRLGGDAAAGIAELRAADVLPEAAHWFSSPEPKALATARRLTSSPIEVVPDLREREVPLRWYGTRAEFAVVVERGMLVPDQPADTGWETSTAATVRLRTAFREIVRRHAAGTAVLVGHGTAWTLLVAALTGAPPDVAAWRRMVLPDHVVIENDNPGAAGWRVVRPWGAWRDRLGHSCGGTDRSRSV